jgi:hypothetical protein
MIEGQEVKTNSPTSYWRLINKGSFITDVRACVYVCVFFIRSVCDTIFACFFFRNRLRIAADDSLKNTDLRDVTWNTPLECHRTLWSSDWHYCYVFLRSRRSAFLGEGFLFLSPSRQLLGYYLKFGYHRFLPYPFQSMINSSPFNPARYSDSYSKSIEIS